MSDVQVIDFDKGDGLIPAIVQDARTDQVLMLGYMNEVALARTRATGKVTFFSRSKQRLWVKGETSGNFLHLESIKVDCDGDTLLVRARPQGPVCHKGTDTCFAETNHSPLGFLHTLEGVIHDRREHPRKGSYTTSLFERGINKIAQKVGEEAVEVVIEAKDENDDLFKNEVADLLYHLMILLEAKKVSLTEIVSVLETRHQ
ncbi:MAG: bifunctional phosphoribosyl-AMP cyclohydrolase/phosphoribosyl-ATP diphosphatase HisIE [Bacteroidetes bacterium]|nr:MAG: bifunctional phosphoribosyl-AMP cyclohydrolase/phosphoribosyl-ATP diphosphatase HisIE [Bacteroidota bacterium]